MRLSDLSVGDNVILQVKINDKFADFPSVVVKQDKNETLFEAIRMGDKVVNFSGENVALDLYFIRPEKPPIVWKRVVCSTVGNGGRTYYRITATAEGFESNRREAFRLFVGITGVAQLGINRKAVNVIVKDVSENGFSFVSNSDMGEVINFPVRLVFEDIGKNYSLMGLVVRKVVISEDKIVYGCKMSVENPEIARYINAKQRQQLQMNNNNSASRMREQLKLALAEGESSKAVALKLAEYNGSNGLKPSANGGRAIDTMDVKDERRDVFKEMHSGKKL